MDADQRAAIIRDLDKHARDAASTVAFMSRKFREFMASEDDGMPAADAVAADQAIDAAMRALPTAGRIFAKYARLLDGPPPSLALRPAGNSDRLDIITPAPSGDRVVGNAERTGTGDSITWRLRLTDGNRVRSSIGLHYDETPDGLLEAVNRHMAEYGPWWTREEASADGQ